ncbi:hypothetical protein N8895_00145 [Candidatus Pelagibacter sp.]|nr:hypothetical protein [Candidatus Pelagibacter sp.]
MIEKFNSIFYLILFSIHFLGLGIYAYQMIIDNKRYREKFQIDETAATIMRMTGAIFLGSFLMAIYVMFVRPNGVEGTWAFFNLVFVQNLCVLIVNTYSIKIDKTGTRNDSNEAVIAPLVFTIISAILCYGLADKIYIY